MFEDNQPFKFNFSRNQDTSEGLGQSQCDTDQATPTVEVVLPSQEDVYARNACRLLTDAVHIAPGVELLKGRLSSLAASQILKEGDLADSDLIPGKYEGGFKLWECAVDLGRFLCRHFNFQSFDQHAHSQLPGCPRVLELGCGQGLPGILLLKAGAEVHFQDYNREVLTALTAPNVSLNTQGRAEGPLLKSARYFSGDWAGLPSLLDQEGLMGTYDVILSAETIYSLDSQQRLLACIKLCLKHPKGQAWIAAKSYYFGVGGGTASFSQLVSRDGTFEVQTVDVIDDGASNKREILLLTFKT